MQLYTRFTPLGNPSLRKKKKKEGREKKKFPLITNQLNSKLYQFHREL